jgi:hypothetical protein
VEGNKDDAQKTLDHLKGLSTQRYVAPYTVAVIYAGLGEKDEAFNWLKRAYDDRSYILAVYSAPTAVWTTCVPILDLMNSGAVSRCRLFMERGIDACPTDGKQVKGGRSDYLMINAFSGLTPGQSAHIRFAATPGHMLSPSQLSEMVWFAEWENSTAEVLATSCSSF